MRRGRTENGYGDGGRGWQDGECKWRKRDSRRKREVMGRKYSSENRIKSSI